MQTQAQQQQYLHREHERKRQQKRVPKLLDLPVVRPLWPGRSAEQQPQRRDTDRHGKQQR
jgi:hypothetical protein